MNKLPTWWPQTTNGVATSRRLLRARVAPRLAGGDPDRELRVALQAVPGGLGVHPVEADADVVPPPPEEDPTGEVDHRPRHGEELVPLVEERLERCQSRSESGEGRASRGRPRKGAGER